MVVIDTQTSANTIYVPKNYAPSASALTFTLKSTVGLDEATFDVQDESGLTDFFVFTIDSTAMIKGEYKYFVKEKDEEAILSSGLAKIGDWEPEKTEYNNPIEYESYEY